jgi:hypothetical protein
MILADPVCQLKHLACNNERITDVSFSSLSKTTMTTCHGLATLDSGTLCTWTWFDSVGGVTDDSLFWVC